MLSFSKAIFAKNVIRKWSIKHCFELSLAMSVKNHLTVDLGLAMWINLDKLSKFNCSLYNLTQQACGKRKQFQQAQAKH